MTRIAHLTDLHLVETRRDSRTRREQFRLSFLTAARSVDAALHRKRFADALERARAARVDHVVITGDLTEDGSASQFEVLAEVLHESGFAPDDVTLVPGNHDGYAGVDAWWNALEGPMRAFRRTSTPGTITELAGATIAAIATTVEQSILRACGRVGREQRALLSNVMHHAAQLGRAVIVAMHHPPVHFGLHTGWLGGLLDRAEMSELLEEHPHAHALCGHVHRDRDFTLGNEREARVHTARAVVASAGLRLYEASGGQVRAVPIDATIIDPSPLAATG